MPAAKTPADNADDRYNRTQIFMMQKISTDHESPRSIIEFILSSSQWLLRSKIDSQVTLICCPC